MPIPVDLQRDAEELEQSIGIRVELLEIGAQILVLLHEVPLPPATYRMTATDILFVADHQYRCSALDMFWTELGVLRLDGAVPENADVVEQYAGRSWRRFSWHRNGVWDPSRNGLLDHYEFMLDRFAKDVL